MQRISLIRNISVSLIGLLSVLLVSLTPGCYYDNEQDLYPDTTCDTTDVSYSAVILPIIDIACYVCHDAATSLGTVNLEGYDALKTYALNGSLIGVLRREAGYSPMPQNAGPLPDCDIDKIESWIQDGALDN